MVDAVFDNPMDGLIKGQNFVNGLFDHAATLAAGRAYQNGDLHGAAGLLGSRGQWDEARAMSDQATAVDALTAANKGDYAGARAAAARGGDPSLYTQTTTAQQQDRAQRLEWMGHATDAIQQVGAGLPPDQQQAKRAEAFQQYIVPTLREMGVGDNQLASIQAGHFTDESLSAMRAAIGQMGKPDIHYGEDGSVLSVDPHTNKVTVLHPGTPKPVFGAPGSSVWLPGDASSAAGQGAASSPAAGASGVGGVAPAAPTGGAYDRVAQIAKPLGATDGETDYLRRTLKIESGGNPKVKNGSSTGMFQFHPDTFASVLPGGNIASPKDQVQATLNLARRDQATLQKLGVDPTPANTYIMHQQGPSGGPALLTAPPEVNAVAALTPVYGGNAAMARRAIVGNGGTADMTAGEFVNMWRNRFDGSGSSAGASSAAAGGSPGAGGLIAPPTGASGGGWHMAGIAPDKPADRWVDLPDGRQRNTRTNKVEGTADGGTDGGLDEDSIQYLAEVGVAKGAAQLPPFGMGKQALKDREAVIKRMAQIEKSTGSTGADAVLRFHDLKANSGALTKLEQTRQAVQSFETNAQLNADMALRLAPKGAGPLRSPVFNKFIQQGRKGLLGDPNVAQYEIALGTFLDEYAKITSGSTGSQGSSDASRREAYDRLNKYASQGQLEAGISTMKQEMHNRVVGMDQQEQRLRGLIRGGGRPGQASAPTAPPNNFAAYATAPVSTAASRTHQALIKAGRYDQKAPMGSANHPYIAPTEEIANHLRKGAYVILPNGDLAQVN